MLRTEPETWLVTGTSGLLGAYLVRALRSPIRLLAATRGSVGPGSFGTPVPCDLRQRGSVSSAILRHKPDVVMHLAAIASHEACARDPRLAHEVNGEATREIVEACGSTGAYLVYVSTDAVFSGTDGNYSEDDTPAPFSVYGETKLLGESHVSSYVNGLIVRTNFFGWGGASRPSILEFFVSGLSSQVEISGFPRYVVSTIYAGHLAEYLVMLAENRHPGLVHVGSSDSQSKYAFGLAVGREFNLPLEYLRPDGGPTLNLGLDVSRFTKILGRVPPTQASGLRSARLEWRRSGGFDL